MANIISVIGIWIISFVLAAAISSLVIIAVVAAFVFIEDRRNKRS